MEMEKQRIVEQLTIAEKDKLQQAIQGYGKLKKAADDAKLHFQTLKNVALIGRGEKTTIEKLRNTILAA